MLGWHPPGSRIAGGEYANDGECDDLRFKGSGMTGTELIEDDIMRDASDCQSAYKAGKLKLNLN